MLVGEIGQSLREYESHQHSEWLKWDDMDTGMPRDKQKDYSFTIPHGTVMELYNSCLDGHR